MTSIGNQDKFLRFHPDGHVVPCPCRQDHGVNILEDGSRRCVFTGEAFEATKDDGDLFTIRKNYEDEILALSLRAQQPWTAIVGMPQPERQALSTSFELVDQFHKNRGGHPAVTTVAVLPAKNREPSVVEGAIALLIAQGWEVFPARAESACDQRTLWLNPSRLQT